MLLQVLHAGRPVREDGFAAEHASLSPGHRRPKLVRGSLLVSTTFGRIALGGTHGIHDHHGRRPSRFQPRWFRTRVCRWRASKVLPTGKPADHARTRCLRRRRQEPVRVPVERQPHAADQTRTHLVRVGVCPPGPPCTPATFPTAASSICSFRFVLSYLCFSFGRR